MTCDALIHVLGDIRTCGLKTFKYDFCARTPKLPNQNSVFIGYDISA